MRTFTALIKREYLEHRGAFLYAPAIILVLLTVVLAAATSFDRVPDRVITFGGANKLFELGFLGVAALWWLYLLGALFFYFADAFNADRRNNAMLFWKSMPVSDFTVLGSKMLAGATIFPALVAVAAAINALLVVLFGYVAVMRVGFLGTPDLAAVFADAGQVALFAIPVTLLTLLWYAPLFAWVGMLSTLVGRWSIPLAFLIPGVIGLFEKLILRGEGPDRGYFLTWLGQRFELADGDALMNTELLLSQGFSGTSTLTRLIALVDWTQMAGGLVVAGIFVALAAEYRRRFTIA